MADAPVPPLVHHRAVLPVHGDDQLELLATVRRCTTAWVRSKHRESEIPSVSGNHRLAEHVTLAVASAYAEDGSETGVRFRLHEDKPNGLWQTTVTAVNTAPDQGWVGIDLEYGPAAESTENPQPPRLIRELTEALPLQDGSALVRARPVLQPALRIGQLVGALTNRERRLPCIVVARPAKPTGQWRKQVQKALNGVAGLASLYELVEPAACNALKAELGDAFRIDPGGIRTFLPGLDPEDPADAHRHRILSQTRLRETDGSAGRIIARNVQDRARQSALPAALRDAAFTDVLQEERDSRERASARDGTADRGSVAALREDLELAQDLLVISDKQIDELRKDNEIASLRVSSLAERNEELEKGVEDEAAEHFLAMDELAKAQEKIGKLRAVLRRAGQQDEVLPADASEPQDLPSSFEELLDTFEHLPHICFTGNPSPALELDEIAGAKGAVWAGKTWKALTSLDSYARAKSEGFAGAFHDFCQNPPPGGMPYAPKQVSMSESQTTVDKYGHQRIFPVPEKVAPGGKTLMQAHLKVDSRGSVSPRVYFLDCTAEHGEIVVGYIGRHLDNTKTN